MIKKLVFALLVLVLLVSVFAPVVRHVSQGMAAERPAAMQMAGGTLPSDATLTPLKPDPGFHTCVGWNT